MKPTLSIFILAIKFDCLFLAIFQTFQWFVSLIFDKLAPPSEYEVCLKSNGTAHAAQTTFIAEKKSIAIYDVTMSYGFENQISTFCNNYILFCTFFCQGTFSVTVLWRFDKNANF